MSRSISATAAVIRSRSSWKLAGTGGTKSVLYKSPQEKSQGVRSGDLGGQRINATSSCPKSVSYVVANLCWDSLVHHYENEPDSHLVETHNHHCLHSSVTCQFSCMSKKVLHMLHDDLLQEHLPQASHCFHHSCPYWYWVIVYAHTTTTMISTKRNCCMVHCELATNFTQNTMDFCGISDA